MIRGNLRARLITLFWTLAAGLSLAHGFIDSLSAYAWLGTLLSQVDRVLVLGFFIYFAYGAGLSRLLRRRHPGLRESAAEA